MAYTHIQFTDVANRRTMSLALWLSPETLAKRLSMSVHGVENMLRAQTTRHNRDGSTITFINKEPHVADKIYNYVCFIVGNRRFTFPIKYAYTSMAAELKAAGVNLSRQQCSALVNGRKGWIKGATVEFLQHADLDPNQPEPGQGYKPHPKVLILWGPEGSEKEVCRFDGNAHRAAVIKQFNDATGLTWTRDELFSMVCGSVVKSYRTTDAADWDARVAEDTKSAPNMVMAFNSDVNDAANAHHSSTLMFTFNGADDLLSISKQIAQHTGEHLGTDVIAQLLNGDRVQKLRAWTMDKWDAMIQASVDAVSASTRKDVDDIEDAQIVPNAAEAPTHTVTVKQKTTVFVTLQREFIHHFPAAVNPEFATGDELDVSFLAHPHRHMWGFRIETEVFHDDRDIEFIQLKRIVESYLDTLPLDLGPMSCEQFAKQIIATLTNVFGARYWDVIVDEDGENGARVTSTPV